MERAARMIEAIQTIAFGSSASEEATAQEDRFAALVERHSRFVFRVAHALLRNSHDAEDAVQETFLKIYRARAWQAIENERAFLARTAWRVAADKLRKVRHEPLDPEMAHSGAASPEQAAVTADWNAAVERLVDALPPELRQPLALSAIDELTSREIAELTGVPEGTVRTRIMRARQILKQKLGTLMEGRHGKR